MTQATDNDLKELKDLMNQGFAESRQQFNELNQKINNLDKKIDDLDKKMAVGFAELSGEIKNNGTKIEALDKRLTESNVNLEKRPNNEEFITRTVVVGLVVAMVGGLFKLLYDHPSL